MVSRVCSFSGVGKQIENIWGNGYFKLEKIIDPMCASAYMAKAAGYITKANGQSDQGEVKGNRYAIRKTAGAPEWYTVGEYEMGMMGSIIREVYDGISDKYGHLYHERKALNGKRDQIRQTAKDIQKRNNGKYPLWAKKRLDNIGNSIKAVKAKIDAISVKATKYQLILTGSKAFNRFLGFARALGWFSNKHPDSHWLHMMKERIYRRKRRREAWQDYELTDYLEEKEQFKDESLSVYDDYVEYLEL